MPGKPSTQVRPVTEALARCFWVAMLVAHAPAMVKAWRYCVADGLQAELLGGCVLLTASMVFFALKLLGVAWLRFRVDRRCSVAMCLVVALIHVDCFQPGAGRQLASNCAVVLATTSMACAVPQLGRTLRAATARGGSARKPRLPGGRLLDNEWLDAFRPRCWVLASRLFSLRAPPA